MHLMFTTILFAYAHLRYVYGSLLLSSFLYMSMMFGRIYCFTTFGQKWYMHFSDHVHKYFCFHLLSLHSIFIQLLLFSFLWPLSTTRLIHYDKVFYQMHYFTTLVNSIIYSPHSQWISASTLHPIIPILCMQ